MKVTHIFTMATPVNCCFTYQDYSCFHDLCRKKLEAEKDYDNAIVYGLSKAKQHKCKVKLQDALKPIRDLWAIFRNHKVNLIPPEWQEFYPIYLEKEEVYDRQDLPKIC
jgi:hypothetical protein